MSAFILFRVFFFLSSFIFSSVFWDLYCAAPERRDTCDHSSEAKAFHDYVSYQIMSVLLFHSPHYYNVIDT